MRKSRARSGHRSLKVGAAVAVAAAAVLAGPAVPAFAATYSVSTTQVAVAGGTFLYLTGGTAFVSTLGIRYAPSAGSCPANYNTALTGTVNGGLIKALSSSVAQVNTPALPAGTYKPCLYADAATGAAYATDTTTDVLTSMNMATPNAVTGKANDKVTLTAASAIFTGSTYASEYVSGVTACPATYTLPSLTVLASSTTKTSTSVLTTTVPAVTAGTPYLICTYVGTTAGSSALVVRSTRTFTSYDATLPTVTLVPTGGSSGTATTVTLSTTDPIFNGTPAALVTFNSCPTTYAAGTNLEPFAATTTKISTSKLAVTMPTSVIVGGADVTTPWNVCVYASSSSGALITAPASYSVAPVLSVSGAQFAVGSGSAAGTGAGPAQGGSSITISGLTGIPTAPTATLTASLGGSPIDNITRIDATSFSGKTTAHAPGTANLSVTTAAGTKSTSTAPYTYTYGITVQPNSASSGSQPVLDIAGAGFSTLTFGNVTDGGTLDSDSSDGDTAYVLLTDNTWNAQTFNGIDALAAKPASYCNTILPISDGEIICTLHLEKKIASVALNAPTFASAGDATDYVPEGTYTVTIVNAGIGLDASDHNYSIVSSGSTFTVAGY